MILDFKALFSRKSSSKSLAKSRLHFVLVQDRTGLTNEEMSGFKQEMINVIEKYFMIDKHAFDIDYKREGDSTTLVINSPVLVRRQDGLNHQVGARHARKGQPEPDPDTSDEAQAAN